MLQCLLFQTGSMSGDVLPPYSEVDLQTGGGGGGGGGGGRVVGTQGDKLNALKRARAHHHHHSRVPSNER